MSNDVCEDTRDSGCPFCNATDHCVILGGGETYFVCVTHDTAWCVGINCYSENWRNYTEEDRRERAQALQRFTIVEQRSWPPLPGAGA